MSLPFPEVDVRYCDEVTFKHNGHSMEVWIGNQLVFIANRVVYVPPDEPEYPRSGW